MSLVDEAYLKATQIWDKNRRGGWLTDYLKGNTKGKKASKEAFIAGYVMATLKTNQGELA